MYARVPQSMAQFVLKIEKLSHIMWTAPIVELARAYGLHPRLWLLLSLMTYASHARVITVIIQTNLIHLSIKMTMPHQSGAPFVGERVFQNRGVCGQAFPSSPSPIPFLSPFCSCPIFRSSRMQKTNTRGQNFDRFVRERLLRRLGFSTGRNSARAEKSLKVPCNRNGISARAGKQETRWLPLRSRSGFSGIKAIK